VKDDISFRSTPIPREPRGKIAGSPYPPASCGKRRLHRMDEVNLGYRDPSGEEWKIVPLKDNVIRGDLYKLVRIRLSCLHRATSPPVPVASLCVFVEAHCAPGRNRRPGRARDAEAGGANLIQDTTRGSMPFGKRTCRHLSAVHRWRSPRSRAKRLPSSTNTAPCSSVGSARALSVVGAVV
jgi:hypothetical protein